MDVEEYITTVDNEQPMQIARNRNCEVQEIIELNYQVHKGIHYHRSSSHKRAVSELCQSSVSTSA